MISRQTGTGLDEADYQKISYVNDINRSNEEVLYETVAGGNHANGSEDNMNIIDKKSHNELINILNELITTIELMRTEKKDYLLNQNQEETKEWLKFLCEHTDKEELKTLEDEIANQFVSKFDVEIDTGELDGRRVSLMKEYLIKSNEFLK